MGTRFEEKLVLKYAMPTNLSSQCDTAMLDEF